MEYSLDFDRERIAWGVFGLLLLGALYVVVRPFVGVFVFSIFLYYSIRPVHRRVNDRISHPNVAATVTLLGVLLPVLLVVGYAVALAVQNLTQLLHSAELLQQYRPMLRPYLHVSTVTQEIRQVVSKLRHSSVLTARSGISAVVSTLGTYFGMLVNVLMRVFLLFAFTFYFLRDDQKLSRWFRGLFADQDSFDVEDGVVTEYVEGVDSDLETVYFGNLVNMLVIAALATVTNYALNFVAPPNAGIPYPILLGLLTGIGSLVPAVGMKIVYVPVAALLFVAAFVGPGPLWFPALYFAVYLVVVDTIPDFVVRAYVSGRSLHTGLVMFAYILGAIVFGWYGIFLGPILLALVLHFGYTVLPYVVHGDSTV